MRKDVTLVQSKPIDCNWIEIVHQIEKTP